MTNEEIKSLIEVTVEQEVERVLSAIFRSVDENTTQRARRGEGPRIVKKSISVPREVWSEIEKLEGSASRHVTTALRIYLNALRLANVSEPD